MHHRQNGFTLIELSIVLVIIGLVVGGVLVGRDLMRAAESRKIISEVEMIHSMVSAFKTKYNALPGDMRDATSYWPTDAPCPLTPARTTKTTATCNGNGDGDIGSSSAPFYEIYRFWQHLSNAGMIGGTFTGTSVMGNSDGLTCDPGVNVLASKVSGVGITVREYTLDGAGYFHSRYREKTFIEVGADTTWNTGAAAFTAQQAFGMDSKLDDGFPGSGSIIAGIYQGTAGFPPNCIVMPLVAPLAYDMTQTGLSCALTFIAGF